MKAITSAGALAMILLGASPVWADEPSLSKGQFCAYLSQHKIEKQRFMLWLTERLTQTELNDALTEQALREEKALAKESIAYYDNMLKAKQCDSAQHWGRLLTEDSI